MKIGILTFHSQLNYGGVLQCWALQIALEKMGHEVVVIDRWLNFNNPIHENRYNEFGARQWGKFCFRTLLGLGDLSHWLRVRHTKKFIKNNLKLTPYHFVKWRDAPRDLGIDLFVVGSDQIWHSGDWGDPRPYLLEDAPDIPAIAYAASFGMKSLPQTLCEKENIHDLDVEKVYRVGLKKFKAISCREKEGVELCLSLGFTATHVVDPTLLLYGEANQKKRKEKKLVCYFMDVPVDSWVALDTFAKKMKCKVEVFLNKPNLHAIPKNVHDMIQCAYYPIQSYFSRFTIQNAAGPLEFIKAFETAEWVITDSFHGLMFSVLYNCNARIIRPTNNMRKQMFARITEFAEHISGLLIVDSLTEGLDSFISNECVEYDSNWLASRVDFSKKWLLKNLE